MKNKIKHIVFPILIICCSTYNASCQSFAIKTNPLSYIVATPSLSLEYQMSDKWSVSAKTFPFIGVGFLEESSQAIGVEGRYYPSGDLQGNHTGLTMGYKWQGNRFAPDAGMFISISSGYQWIFSGHYIIDVGVSVDGARDSGELALGVSSVIGLGYRF